LANISPLKVRSQDPLNVKIVYDVPDEYAGIDPGALAL
jgi:hypothetical protein